MQLRCIRAFGNFKPGDELDVPDGAVFDGFYFERTPEAKPAAKKEGK